MYRGMGKAGEREELLFSFNQITYNPSYTVRGPLLLLFPHLFLYLLLPLWFYLFLSSVTVSFAWWQMVICRCSLCCDTHLWTSTVPDLWTARTYRQYVRTCVRLNVCVCVRACIYFVKWIELNWIQFNISLHLRYSIEHRTSKMSISTT